MHAQCAVPQEIHHAGLRLGMSAAGFVLAGGNSTRMGRDKALLPVGPHTLVRDIADKVAVVAGTCVLIGDPERYQETGLECVPDLRPGCGALGGIETALALRRAEFNVIVACDMPGLQVDWLERLMRRAENTQRSAVVARDDAGNFHPLCAVYKSAALATVKRALNARRFKLMDVIAELDAEEVRISATIYNLNSPTDWDEWQTHITREG